MPLTESAEFAVPPKEVLIVGGVDNGATPPLDENAVGHLAGELGWSDPSLVPWSRSIRPQAHHHSRFSRLAGVPLASIGAFFFTYQNDPRFSEAVFNHVAPTLITHIKSGQLRTLVGHSHGAVVILDSIKKLYDRGILSEEELRKICLVLLAPNLGRPLYGLVSPIFEPDVIARRLELFGSVFMARIQTDMFSCVPEGMSNRIQVPSEYHEIRANPRELGILGHLNVWYRVGGLLKPFLETRGSLRETIEGL